MGVDAKMYVRLPAGHHVDPADVPRIAHDLVSVIGNEYFVIDDADMPPRYEWHKPHHAISIIGPITEGDDAYEWYLEKGYAKVGDTVISNDGPPVILDPSEQLLRLHLMGRYYGPGYERGDWKSLLLIIMWLRRRFPAGQVWYGGDSSGVLAEHMTQAAIDRITECYLGVGHEPYVSGFGNVFGGGRHVGCPTCGDVPMHNCGGGGDREFYRCSGCGRQEIVVRGVRHRMPRHGKARDFFEASQRIQAGQPLCDPRDPNDTFDIGSQP